MNRGSRGYGRLLTVCTHAGVTEEILFGKPLKLRTASAGSHPVKQVVFARAERHQREKLSLNS